MLLRSSKPADLAAKIAQAEKGLYDEEELTRTRTRTKTRTTKRTTTRAITTSDLKKRRQRRDQLPSAAALGAARCKRRTEGGG